MTAACVACAVRWLTGATARWQGCDPLSTKPRVYFANHTSNLDFVLLWSALPPPQRARTRPAAAHDYWSATALRRRIATDIFRAVLIERQRVTRANNPVVQLLAVLDAGDSVIIFPEGTRAATGSGEVGEFKSGLYHIATARPDVELIPVFINNLSRVLPKGEILPVPILCSVTLGPPLERPPVESKAAFLARARDAVIQLSLP